MNPLVVLGAAAAGLVMLAKGKKKSMTGAGPGGYPVVLKAVPGGLVNPSALAAVKGASGQTWLTSTMGDGKGNVTVDVIAPDRTTYLLTYAQPAGGDKSLRKLVSFGYSADTLKANPNTGLITSYAMSDFGVSA